MGIPANIVTTSADYSVLCARASSIFHLNRGGLPEQVFVDGFTNFGFVEFDVMLTPEFWNVLAACTVRCGDLDVSVIVHEPDPEAYYFSNFHRYGALRFEPNALMQDYSNALWAEPEGSPADALQFVASTVSWCGSSKEWAFWGERGLGIGIAATRRVEMPWPSVEGVNWFNVDSALRSLVAPNFLEQAVPPEFAAKLRRNFRG